MSTLCRHLPRRPHPLGYVLRLEFDMQEIASCANTRVRSGSGVSEDHLWGCNSRHQASYGCSRVIFPDQAEEEEDLQSIHDTSNAVPMQREGMIYMPTRRRSQEQHDECTNCSWLYTGKASIQEAISVRVKVVVERHGFQLHIVIPFQ